MSAGRFQDSKYTSNAGTICNIRIQPETEEAQFAGVANSPTASAATSTLGTLVLKKGNRGLGLRVRFVTCRWATSDVPTGYSAFDTFTIPILQASVYNGIDEKAIATNTTYLGKQIVVISKTGEKTR
jgi:hypothetical protein